MGVHDTFDPKSWEDLVCMSCETPLTQANVFEVDITDDDKAPWEQRTPDDAPRTKLLYCVDCVLDGKVETEEWDGS